MVLNSGTNLVPPCPPFAALLFVIDSTDAERLDEVSDELAALVSEKQLKDSLLLIFANKQVYKENSYFSVSYSEEDESITPLWKAECLS